MCSSHLSRDLDRLFSGRVMKNKLCVCHEDIFLLRGKLHVKIVFFTQMNDQKIFAIKLQPRQGQ